MPATATATIARDELRALLERDEPLTLIEALPAPFYRKAHLPGAINLPPEQVETLAPSLLPDKQAAIVVYCADLACGNSTVATRQLTALGYTNVREYAEGKQDWLAAGLPVETKASRGKSRPVRLSAEEAADALPVSCALPADQLAERVTDLQGGLFASVEETHERPNGMAYRVPGTDAILRALFDFVAEERVCCTFLRFDLTFEPGQGPLWLRLTGPVGAKEFIQRTFKTGLGD